MSLEAWYLSGGCLSAWSLMVGGRKRLPGFFPDPAQDNEHFSVMVHACACVRHYPTAMHCFAFILS